MQTGRSNSGKGHLQRARQDAVNQTAAGDADAAADSIPHDGPNGVQPCCRHLYRRNDCKHALAISKDTVVHKQCTHLTVLCFAKACLSHVMLYPARLCDKKQCSA